MAMRRVVASGMGSRLSFGALFSLKNPHGKGSSYVHAGTADRAKNGTCHHRPSRRFCLARGRRHRATNPAFVLTHALEDPYNFDHPNAAHFAQETRVIAQAMGHKPGAQYKYSAPPVFLFEPHQPEMCNYKPNLILKIDEVWEQKYKAFQILAAQKHLWAYYERVALNRGMQGSRNTGVPMTYGEAYQRLFPTVEEILK